MASDNTILVAVVGPTGSGKSTFANLASGSNLPVGEGLESCTAEIQASDTFMLDGKRVILFDTPGFDDSNLNDVEVLRRITTYLSFTYQKGRKLSGILYFHRISDYRMGGISKKNFHMFSELCGSEVMNNVVIVTNMWETISQEIGERRERQLSITADHFGSAVNAGAKMIRHYNNYESTKNILRLVLPNVPEPLRIQKEIADRNLQLHETSAGKVLCQEQEQMIRDHQKQIDELKQQMSQQTEAEKKMLDTRIQELDNLVKTAQADSEALKRSWESEKHKYEGIIRELEQKLDKKCC